MTRLRLPAIATLLSLLACYGSLVALAALGALGFAISLNEQLWAGTIVLFAVLAVIGLFFGRQRHGATLPLVLGAAGAAAIIYTMYVDYSRLIELLGFLGLGVAVVLDWRQG